MSRFEMCLRAGLGAILFGAWVGLTYYPAPNDSALLMFIQVSIGGLAGHSVKSSQPTKDAL